MKTKTLFINCILIMTTCVRCFSNDVTLPDDRILESLAKESGDVIEGISPDDIIYQEGDWDEPAKGKVRKADVRWLERVGEVMTQRMGAAADDGGGKRNPWYPALESMCQGVLKVVATEAEADLLALMAPMIAYHEREEGVGDDFGEPLQEAQAYLLNSSNTIIRALANHIKNGTGPMEEGLYRQAVRLFGNGRLLDESAWDEDDRMPVDSAGIFILNPVVALDELKKRPPERVRDFLCNVKDPAAFFRRYVGEGDGLERLKLKYGAEKAAIDAKFVELEAWAATLPDE